MKRPILILMIIMEIFFCVYLVWVAHKLGEYEKIGYMGAIGWILHAINNTREFFKANRNGRSGN